MSISFPVPLLIAESPGDTSANTVETGRHVMCWRQLELPHKCNGSYMGIALSCMLHITLQRRINNPYLITFRCGSSLLIAFTTYLVCGKEWSVQRPI